VLQSEWEQVNLLKQVLEVWLIQFVSIPQVDWPEPSKTGVLSIDFTHGGRWTVCVNDTTRILLVHQELGYLRLKERPIF
jgi:hypothetical protein